MEYAIGASSQGARGLESFAAASTNRNAHRRVVAALGYPEKAPKLSWIEIPVAGGGVKPQPILCPIDTLEALLTDPEKFQKHLRGEDLNVQDLWYCIRDTMQQMRCTSTSPDRLQTSRGPRTPPITVPRETPGEVGGYVSIPSPADNLNEVVEDVFPLHM